MRYQMYRDNSSQYRWRLWSSNNRIVADSAESYHNKADCQHGINLVKGSSNAPVHDDT